MRKIAFLSALLVLNCHSLFSQRTQWDRSIQLKSCSIAIKADQFIATTFIEMEFYNPNTIQVEGLYEFELKPGQVITAFQLSLNGKYRDGSIEERWKATRAYSAIVGKRIDPALLSMAYPDHYRLNIFPFVAKGTRKVTMTIQQLLRAENGKLVYSLPLKSPDTTSTFNLNIDVTGSAFIPTSRAGIIGEKSFMAHAAGYTLNWNTSGIILNRPISFSIPVQTQSVYCTERSANQTFFALQLKPGIASKYPLNPKTITVYWDASASTSTRNISKEINYLKQFVAFHKVQKLTIIPFNTAPLDTAEFETVNNDGAWKKYLNDIEYRGATQLGCIDLTTVSSDLTMIFTDGKNTYGKSRPKNKSTIVFAIYSTFGVNWQLLNAIVGTSGGRSSTLLPIQSATP